MLLLASTLAAVTTVKAQQTTLSVQPPTIINPAIDPDTLIVINASVADVTSLYTWQIKLHFNPQVLNCNRAWYPSDHVFAGKPYIPVTPVIDNTNGYITFGASLMGEASFIGNGTLCQIEFKVLKRGHSHLNFSEPYGEDTFLLDYYLEQITANIVNGYFDNRLAVPEPPVAVFDYYPKPPIVNEWVTFDASGSYDPDGTIVSYDWDFDDGTTDTGSIVTHKFLSAGTFYVNLTVTDDQGYTDSEVKEIVMYETPPAKLYIDPPEIVDPNLRPPTIISINVTVDDVTDLYDYEFKLGYNTEMLTCIGAVINRVQNQTNFSPIILIDDPSGYLWVNVTYYPPATPITTTEPLALVTVYFQIDGLGSSILDLYDTELSDSNRQQIPHETQDGFIMILIRDVEITHVAPSANWAYQGWPVDITVKARNNGNISETFDVNVYYDSNLITTLHVVDLAPDTETILNTTWDTTGVPEGNYTLSAEATTVPYEYNTTNNFLEDGQVRIFTTIRDVAVTNVTASRSWVFPGMQVNITITAKNLGEVTETFEVKAYYDTNLIGTYPVNLTIGEEITITFTWNTTGLAPCNNYTLFGEATMVPYEYNATNNIFEDGSVKIRVLGDLNGDNTVDMKDVAIVAAAFGSYPGHPRWNPDADVTGTEYLVPDDAVDMRDVAIISKNFGNSC